MAPGGGNAVWVHPECVAGDCGSPRRLLGAELVAVGDEPGEESACEHPGCEEHAGRLNGFAPHHQFPIRNHVFGSLTTLLYGLYCRLEALFYGLRDGSAESRNLANDFVYRWNFVQNFLHGNVLLNRSGFYIDWALYNAYR